MARQTADTFQAASTFLELCQIWGPLDTEIASKIKFAKYHALRIAKAIKAGEDPNLTNPKSDALRDEEGNASAVPHASGSTKQHDEAPQLQPTVEDAIEENPDQESTYSPPASQSVEHYYQQPPAQDVSPLAPSSGGQVSPINGGYFPHVPEDMSASIPREPSPQSNGIAPFSTSNVPFPQSPDLQPNNLQFPPTATSSESNLPPQPPPIASPHGAPGHGTAAPDQSPSLGLQGVPIAYGGNPGAHPSVQARFKDDEASVMAAQKHARFAISALNFEDVPTAVEQLRKALETLGVKP